MDIFTGVNLLVVFQREEGCREHGQDGPVDRRLPPAAGAEGCGGSEEGGEEAQAAGGGPGVLWVLRGSP